MSRRCDVCVNVDSLAQGRVAKRSRKLIDYDSARHHVETLQMSGMKNDRKMMKVSGAVPPRRLPGGGTVTCVLAGGGRAEESSAGV